MTLFVGGLIFLIFLIVIVFAGIRGTVYGQCSAETSHVVDKLVSLGNEVVVYDNILAYSDYIFICNWNFTCGGIWEIMIIKAKTISGLDHADLDLVSQSNLKSLNCKISMDDPDLGHWDYRYDPNGNLIFQSGGGGKFFKIKK